jgi:uncharacterized membrane protein
MDLARTLKHALTPAWLAHRAFKPADLAAITVAVTAAENSHRGELCIVAEGPLSIRRLLADQAVRMRAQELFGQFRVWDTREHCGILIYVQLVERRVEILADRGMAAKLSQPEWDVICREMETAFKAGAYRRGILDAIDRVTCLLALHFPARGKKTKKLPDRLVLI